MARPRVFLSYRREDTRHVAGRLADHLKDRFDIFMDVETIMPGSDFTQAVHNAVSESDVLLALIGTEWTTLRDRSGRRRLDDPADWVVNEIWAGLTRQRTVIPVLIDGARMPSPAELPPALAGLASRQAVSLRHESFADDANRLATVIDRVAGTTTAWQPPAGAPVPSPPRKSRRGMVVLVALLALVLVAGGVGVGIALLNGKLGASGTPSVNPTPSKTSSKKPTTSRPTTTRPTTQSPTPTATPSPPQLDLTLGTTAHFEYYDVTAYAVTPDPTYGLLVQAKVCVVRLTGSNPTTSQISWSPWSVTTTNGQAVKAGLADPSSPPPQMFAQTGQYEVGHCAEGVIPFAGVTADDPVVTVGYSNQFGNQASWNTQ